MIATEPVFCGDGGFSGPDVCSAKRALVRTVSALRAAPFSEVRLQYVHRDCAEKSVPEGGRALPRLPLVRGSRDDGQE